MQAASLLHAPWPPYVQYEGSGGLRVLLKAKQGEIAAAYVVYGDRYKDDMSGRATLGRVGSDGIHDYFMGRLTLSSGRLKYVFYLETHDGQEGWFSEAGWSHDPWSTRVFQMPHVAALPAWDGPDWAQDAVCYQVFVDRFRNGNPGNDPPSVSDWCCNPGLKTRLGGDLQGVIDALPYLEDLGVSMIYLTPIFLAPSAHKYDPVDYYEIDPEFGDLDTLRALTAQAHARNMYVVLDGVFNHCGAGFFAFQDVLRNGEASSYRDWFYVHDYPVRMYPPNYETFGAAIAEMPKLRLSNPQTAEYFLDVATYWIREAGIDGWRLDVANEMDLDFLRELRRRVRAIHPQAYIVGEIWHPAEPWLRGDTLDGVTAYPWRDAALAFFSGWRSDAAWLDGQLTKHYTGARSEALRSSLNLLGSHDTPRVLELMGGDRNKAKLLAAFQFVSPGIPQIYYGDEVGMRGWSDPECRRGMVWDPNRQDHELLSLYKHLSKLRKQYPALRRGGFRSLWHAQGDPLYAMLRTHESGNVVGIFNTAWHERELELPGGWLRSDESVEMIILTGWGHLMQDERQKTEGSGIRRTPISLRMGPQSACLLVAK
ncbi:MAG: alpha-glycosidase [Firmicutes bacterium]|nr:alpha-glycosidase [Bacillota bacterium]